MARPSNTERNVAMMPTARLVPILVVAGLAAACQPTAFPERALADGGSTAPLCPDWREARLEHPLDPMLGNPVPAGGLLLGCPNEINLARMAARPEDLVDGGRTGPTRAPAEVGAVRRYYDNQVTPLPDRSMQTIGQGD